MSDIFRSLMFALANIFHPRMLWLMVWPVLIALAIWGSVAIVFWTQLALWLAAHLKQWMESATFFVTWDAGDAAFFAARVLILLMLVPLIQLTSLLILGVFGMPPMVEHVAARRFPQLARKRGGTSAGSVWNSALALAGLAGLGLASIPLWIFPPLWPVIPVLIMGWVNQRVLRYDALSEHAAADEMRGLYASNRGALYLLGVVLALVAYIPIIGFFAPVLFGLAVIHYLLGELQALREAPLEGEAVRL